MFCMSFAEIMGAATRANKHTGYITRAALRRMLALTKQAEHAEHAQHAEHTQHAQPAARFAALAADLVRHRRRVRTEQSHCAAFERMRCNWTLFERGFTRRAQTRDLIFHNVYDVKSDSSDDSE